MITPNKTKITNLSKCMIGEPELEDQTAKIKLKNKNSNKALRWNKITRIAGQIVIMQKFQKPRNVDNQ
ncbi:hypothetical protein C1H46_000509 [Malus baccata]|uniref:Uncharacterized protein n=1 Tax=Malus baccata TaxID=106549 RepID=A0A540NS56_MALBA|nr:hypothetical protein C1H46_000509 [Malus baccata]